jgi:hypothetical protein
MGGNAQAVQKLNTFFTQLNATRYLPYDWAGNEPSLWTPWEYDYFGAPSQTQKVVRDIMDTLYSNSPVNEPGNDDLGAIASWYVWAAIGLYPVTPGSANLALGSPIFPNVVITLPNNRRIVMHAPAASPSTPYIRSLVVSGVKAPPQAASCPAATSASGTKWNQPWVPQSIINSGGTLTYSLSSSPDTSWGALSGASPPSFGDGRLPAVGYSNPSGGITVQAGQTATIALGLQPSEVGTTTVNWKAHSTGLQVSPVAGVFNVKATMKANPGGAGCSLTAPAIQTVSVATSTTPGSYTLNITMKTSGGQVLPPVVVDVTVIG